MLLLRPLLSPTLEIGCIFECGIVPVESLDPSVKMWIGMSDYNKQNPQFFPLGRTQTKVAFKVAMINRVISDGGGV